MNNNHHYNNARTPSGMPAMPQSFPDPNDTYSMIAQEMNQMTLAERELVFEDIHGVSQINNEEPGFVNKCLNELQEAISNIRDKSAYIEAVTLSPEYIQGRKFMLMFLRSTNFDVKTTASRIVEFLEYKKFYFGSALLGRPILYSDLNHIEKEILRNGWIQVLPFRDMAGRAVVWANYSVDDVNKPAINLMRAAWYFFMSILEDEETQKRGIVLVVCGANSFTKLIKIRDILWRITHFSSYAPRRLAGGHFCIESQSVLPAVAFSQNGQQKSERARNRIHVGCQTEWMYKLMTFGIPVNYAPITDSGDVKVKYFRQWLQQRSKLESSLSTSSPLSSLIKQEVERIVVLPGRNDVLMGRGCVSQNYAGNLLFHQILSKYRKQYANATSNKGRLDITNFVWRLLDKEQVRFLEKTKHGWWKVMTDEKSILAKVKDGLRVKKSGGAAQQPQHDEVVDDKEMNDNDDSQKVSFLNQTEYSEYLIPCCNPAKRKKTCNNK